MAAIAEVVVQPKTITNLKVSDGTNTYPVEELNYYSLSTTGHYFEIGTGSKLDVGNLTFTADNCQTQTYNCYSDTSHTIVMEPAPGYKKMYAWALGGMTYYTNSATPNVGDELYRYESSSDEYIAEGTIIAVSTDTLEVQPFM